MVDSVLLSNDIIIPQNHQYLRITQHYKNVNACLLYTQMIVVKNKRTKKLVGSYRNLCVEFTKQDYCYLGKQKETIHN